MNKYQKVIYRTAKRICTNDINKNNLIKCYKSRLKDSIKHKYSFEKVKNMLKEQINWDNWFKEFDNAWNEDIGRCLWINRITKEKATEEDNIRIFGK